jgi:hypothetical protein
LDRTMQLSPPRSIDHGARKPIRFARRWPPPVWPATSQPAIARLLRGLHACGLRPRAWLAASAPGWVCLLLHDGPCCGSPCCARLGSVMDGDDPFWELAMGAPPACPSAAEREWWAPDEEEEDAACGIAGISGRGGGWWAAPPGWERSHPPSAAFCFPPTTTAGCEAERGFELHISECTSPGGSGAPVRCVGSPLSASPPTVAVAPAGGGACRWQG